MNQASKLRALRCAVAGMTVAIAGAASAQVCCKKPADAPAPPAATAPAPTPAAAPAPAPTAEPAKKATAPKPAAAPVAVKPTPKPIAAVKPAPKVASSESLAYIRSMTAILQGGAKQ